MRESAIRARGLQLFRKRGWLAYTTHGSPFSGRGLPDTVGCAEGCFFAVEWKVPSKKPTPIQLHRLQEIRAAEGIAFWSDDADAAVKEIELLMDNTGERAWTEEVHAA